ncbi:MAG: hypothetical protein RSB05_04740 [Clostridiales bacterium]
MDINVGSGRTLLSYHTEKIGEDIVVKVLGGKAHIGSVAVGCDGKNTVITAKTHKDNFLAEPLIKALIGEFSCNCVVMAGFHADDITKEEIATVLKNHQKGISLVVNSLKK